MTGTTALATVGYSCRSGVRGRACAIVVQNGADQRPQPAHGRLDPQPAIRLQRGAHSFRVQFMPH